MSPDSILANAIAGNDGLREAVNGAKPVGWSRYGLRDGVMPENKLGDLIGDLWLRLNRNFYRCFWLRCDARSAR
jgi:hypothetical protein